MQNINVGGIDELDKEFIMLCQGNQNKINLFQEIEKRSDKLTKHQKLRVDSWVRILLFYKLIQLGKKIKSRNK